MRIWNDGVDQGLPDSENPGLWKFRNEMELYCVNDVFVLGKIMMGYHQAAFDKFGMSPWMNATAPSFVHEVYITKLSAQLELDEMESGARESRLQELAWNEHWGVLKPSEYWFCRRALRGGRTEIKQTYCSVSEQEQAQGVIIRYQDICSEYPYQQVKHNFPVGLPTVHVYDPEFAPCKDHANAVDEPCACPPHTRLDSWLKIEKFYDTDRNGDNVVYTPTVVHTSESFLAVLQNTNYCGIVCATVIPPKDLWHPILMHYDHTTEKCVASNEKIVRGYWPTPIFKRALEMGYVIEKLHRYDRYNSKPSLWRDVMLDLFLEKMINSKDTPTGEKAQSLIDGYTRKFGTDLGDMVAHSINSNAWGRRDARKQTAKVMMNSAWGKHAQRPIMPKNLILDCNEDIDKVYAFFKDCSDGRLKFYDGYPLTGSRINYKYEENSNHIPPDLHGGYLPAAVFVTCYGQLQLWEQMNAIDSDPDCRRVLMCDTDSIVYKYMPGKYNIPEGSLLGEWEVEDEDKDNGGIVEFVGMGPKTYGFKCLNGYSKVKAKGISLNLACSDLVNFDVMKSLVVSHLSTGETSRIVNVPQTNFIWNFARGMTTYRMLKQLKFNHSEMKGDLDRETGYIVPFGFSRT